MCKLFFILDKNKKDISKKIITDFLDQGKPGRKKNTPSLKNPLDHHDNPDGYGLAWIPKNHLWKTYKYPDFYLNHPNSLNIIEKIHSHIIIGHVRKRDKTINTKSMENTHPFTYKNFVFTHNGKIKNYNMKMRTKLIDDYISPKFKSHILGQTDTEVIFYILLSLMDENDNPKDNICEKMEFALIQFFEICKSSDIEILANFMFANKTNIIITRYIRYNKSSDKALSLYICNSPEYLTISSEIVLPDEKYEIIPENTIIIIDYIKKTASVNKI
jgi:predicted glutamine amidotransferase